MHHYTCSIEIGADPAAVFAFHTDPANLLRISPRHLHVDILRHDPPAEGAEVELRVRPLRLFSQHWRLRFDLFDPPRRLGDVMISGPFAHWKQVREFIPLRNGNTLLSDSVEYALPFGRIGRLANTLFIGHEIKSMFHQRQKRTKRLLEMD
ncbi:MAG: SRPBCC family protein [Bacteroidota bacterium]|nr:SRPBCC family protein [Bacteroidota bacterium]